jgi:hypothetical protein
MQRDLTDQERLKILRAGDKLRTWSSLDDERLCVLCERILSGRQIEILRDQRGRYLLKCPTSGCDSFAAHWFYVGNATDWLGERRGLPGRMSSRTGKVTGKTAAPHNPPHGDSTVRPISTGQKRPTIGQAQKLLLAALRLWELKNGYSR